MPQTTLIVVGGDAPDLKTGSSSTRQLLEERLDPRDRESVEFLGQVAASDIPEILQLASVCLFPSYAEALPVAWLEAMAAGRPVVAYDVGWAPELIATGSSGILVEEANASAFGEAVVELLESPQEALRLGRAARNTAMGRFTARHNAQRTADWYREILGNRH